MLIQLKNNIIGQAMTETLIIASTILVPLFLLIPLLGKLIDIKHSSIQAARYEAWEFTVWYADDRQTSDGFQNIKKQDLDEPVKSVAMVKQESQRRFFSDPSIPIAIDDSNGWVSTDSNPLWKDHRGMRLWDGDRGSATDPISSDPTPDFTGGIMSFVVKAISAIFGAMAQGLGAIIDTSLDFDPMNLDGFARSQVTLPVNLPAGLINFATITDIAGTDNSTTALQLVFSAKAAVLTDNWNAGGYQHNRNRVGALVPTKMINELLNKVPGLPFIRGALGKMIPELAPCTTDPSDPGQLWLGYIDSDTVHPDRLEGVLKSKEKGHKCSLLGVCELDPEPTFSNKSDCEP
jgi:hypothetical protein